jgi:hypothetical protein
MLIFALIHKVLIAWYVLIERGGRSEEEDGVSEASPPEFAEFAWQARPMASKIS